MVYQLPTHGEADWDEKLDGSLDYLKATAEGAATTAANAQAAANTALSTASTAAQKASNLADLGNASAARGNLGLGSAATSDASAFDGAGAAGSAQAFAIQRSNHTGTQSADSLIDGTTNKAYTATEKTKLAGVATSATANSSDATLLNRANHTGFDSITGLRPGAVVVVIKDPTTGFWPTSYAADGTPSYTAGANNAGVRPTSRGDIMVIWKGPDPSPAVVTTGTAGMRDQTGGAIGDERHVTT